MDVLSGAEVPARLGRCAVRPGEEDGGGRPACPLHLDGGEGQHTDQSAQWGVVASGHRTAKTVRPETPTECFAAEKVLTAMH